MGTSEIISVLVEIDAHLSSYKGKLFYLEDDLRKNGFKDISIRNYADVVKFCKTSNEELAKFLNNQTNPHRKKFMEFLFVDYKTSPGVNFRPIGKIWENVDSLIKLLELRISHKNGNEIITPVLKKYTYLLEDLEANQVSYDNGATFAALKACFDTLMLDSPSQGTQIEKHPVSTEKINWVGTINQLTTLFKDLSDNTNSTGQRLIENDNKELLKRVILNTFLHRGKAIKPETVDQYFSKDDKDVQGNKRIKVS